MTYNGLVVGGPLDGELLKHSHSIYDITLRDPEGNTAPYRYAFFDTEHGIQIWVAQDLTPYDCLIRMCAHYHQTIQIHQRSPWL